MNDLDTIERRADQLRDRLVSALAFASAAAAAAVLVSVWRQYLLFVAIGAACWWLIEAARLRLAAEARESALDQLVLAGSHDPRCERRRADLASARAQYDVARSLRRICEQSHGSGLSAAAILDRHAVRAVEHDLQELAATFDRAAGDLPPEAVVRTRMLIALPWSPLYAEHPDIASEGRAIQDAKRMIARCRADIHTDGNEGAIGRGPQARAH
jgi:hypothetical protein